MSQERHSDLMDRRAFLKIGSLGAAATATVWKGTPALAEQTAAPAPDGVVHRTLGRTGLKITVVSLGAMRTEEPAVMQAAFDRGVNYVDTAACYKNGNNERVVGQALKGRRDKVYLATKVHMVAPKDAIIRSLEESLTRLQTDYVDVLQLHHPNKEELLREEPKEALAELRKQGKARYVGLSVHSDEVNVLNAVVDDPDKFYDVVLVTCNYKTAKEQRDAITRAAKAKIGIVAMKTQQGGYQTKELGDISPHQASLKFVLQDPSIHAAIPSMTNLDHVKEDTAVMQMDLKLTRADREILERYAEAVKPYYCHMCNACRATCPQGVDICTINRALMYAEGYRDLELARNTYAELPVGESAAACKDCSTCVARCVNGLNIAAKMHKARTLLA